MAKTTSQRKDPFCRILSWQFLRYIKQTSSFYRQTFCATWYCIFGKSKRISSVFWVNFYSFFYHKEKMKNIPYNKLYHFPPLLGSISICCCCNIIFHQKEALTASKRLSNASIFVAWQPQKRKLYMSMCTSFRTCRCFLRVGWNILYK